jgi:hypothetical protein
LIFGVLYGLDICKAVVYVVKIWTEGLWNEGGFLAAMAADSTSFGGKAML